MIGQNSPTLDQRREDILSAALKCFTQKGFIATRMVDIAAEASMSVGNLYNYFKSKDEIVERFSEIEIDRITTRIRETVKRLDQIASHREAVKQYVLMRLNPASARIMLEILFEAEHNEKIRNIVVGFDKQWREALKEPYLETGLTPEQTQSKIEADLCILNGLVVRALTHRDMTLKEKENLAERISQIIIQ